MAEDSAFPKLEKTGRLISRPDPARRDETEADSGPKRDLSLLFPITQKPVSRHTQGGIPRRLLAALRRIPSDVGALFGEEAIYGHGFLFVPVIIGAGAVYWFMQTRDPNVWPFVAAFLVLSFMAVIVRHHHGMARLIPLGLALFIDGMLLAQIEIWRRSTVMIDSPVTTEVTGRIERREIDAKGRWRYILRLERTANPEVRRPPERVQLLARGQQTAFESGEVITGRARLSPPSGPALPGLNNFAFSSYFDGIGAIGFFYGTPKATAGMAVSKSWSAEIERWLFDLRGQISARIRSVVTGDAGAFAAAIVTDERRAISEETTEALRLAGLAHIIAISGLNMALAAGIFYVGARTALSLFTGFAQARAIKKIAAFGALVMVTAYYLISGFGVSAERAYIMMAVILIAVLFDRPSISLRNVALSALIILAMSPSEVLGPSFQMSFAATVALVAGYAFWKDRRKSREPERPLFHHPAVTIGKGIWIFLAGGFMTSLIGGLSTTIFSVEHFHRITTYGLVANVASMPLISFVVMPAGLIGMLLMPFGLDGPWLKLMGLGLDGVIAIARYVAAWGGDVAVGRQHAWFLGLSTVGFLLLTLMRTRLRLIGMPFIAIGLWLSSVEVTKPRPDILVSEDGSLVAFLEGNDVMTNRVRPPDFIYGQWKRALMTGESEPPLVLTKPKVPEKRPAKNQSERNTRLSEDDIQTARRKMEGATSGRFTCEPRSWCAAVTMDGVIVIVVEDGRYAGLACDVGHIVIAPRSRFDTCRSEALIINGTTLRKAGALEIFLNATTNSARWQINAALAGHLRPWSEHRHYDWRRKEFDDTLPEVFRRMINGTGG